MIEVSGKDWGWGSHMKVQMENSLFPRLLLWFEGRIQFFKVKQKTSVSAGFWSLFNGTACFIKANKRNREIIHMPLQFNDEKTVL